VQDWSEYRRRETTASTADAGNVLGKSARCCPVARPHGPRPFTSLHCCLSTTATTMTREESDSLTRLAVNEFRGRELGHTEAESLIEDIRTRLHEDLAMMAGVTLVPHSGR
jgi:hypothetical protein